MTAFHKLPIYHVLHCFCSERVSNHFRAECQYTSQNEKVAQIRTSLVINTSCLLGQHYHPTAFTSSGWKIYWGKIVCGRRRPRHSKPSCGINGTSQATTAWNYCSCQRPTGIWQESKSMTGTSVEIMLPAVCEFRCGDDGSSLCEHTAGLVFFLA